MKHNLGNLDRVFRFALAVWWLGFGTPQVPYEWLTWVFLAIAWIALVESFIGWCGLHAWFGINNKE